MSTDTKTHENSLSTPMEAEEVLAAIYRHPDNVGDTTIWDRPVIMGTTEDGYTQVRMTSAEGDVDEVLFIRKRITTNSYQIVLADNY